MAKDYKDLVVGLDIGTSKVMAVVAEVLPGGELRSERLATAQIGAPGQEREVALYALFGASELLG